MKRTINAESAEKLCGSIFDENNLHKEAHMRETYGVPAIVSGFQLLWNALSTVDEKRLKRVNYIEAHFASLVPVGSEIELGSKEKGEDIRLTASVAGIESLVGGKDEVTLAKTLPMNKRNIGFYESQEVLNKQSTYANWGAFQETTGLPNVVVPSLYAASIATASITSMIRGGKGSWEKLRQGITIEEPRKVKVPAYISMGIFFPRGLTYSGVGKLALGSVIKRAGTVYTIETSCHDNEGLVCGVTSRLKQNRLSSIVKAIEGTLEAIEKAKQPGPIARLMRKTSEEGEPSSEPSGQP